MEFFDASLLSYCNQYSTPPDTICSDNEAYTIQHHPHAHMHSGHLQGLFLEMISFMIQPLRVLEIGTFTGYSALCLSKGLAEGGKLHTIEKREEDAKTAAAYFNKSERNDSIILHIGDAKQIIPTLKESWDLVFIDADKVGYIDYYKLTLPQVKKGGFIIADNVLFHGQVVEPEVKGKNAKAIQDFNAFVAADEQVNQVIVTVRDGLSIIRKI